MPTSYSVEQAAKMSVPERREVFCRMNPVYDPTGSLDSPTKGTFEDLRNGSPEIPASTPETKPHMASPIPQQNGTHSPPGDGRTTATMGSNEGRIDITPDEPRHNPRRWRQHLAALLAALSAVSVGYVDAWTANALPFLQAKPDFTGLNISQVTHAPNDSLWTPFESNATDDYSLLDTFPYTTPILPVEDRPSFSIDDFTSDVIHGINSEQSSWLSSLVPIGAMIGSIPAGILADKMGRKIILLYMTLPCLVSWLMIIFGSHSLVWLFLCRTIQGVIMGIVLVVVPLYNEEISEVEVRGAIGVYQNMMVTVGILMCYLVGAFVPYRWTAIIPCAIPVCMLITFFWMPESPVFLASKDRIAEAIKALQWLRGEKFCDASSVLGRNTPQSVKEQPTPSAAMELHEMGGHSHAPSAHPQTQAQTSTERRGSWLKVPPLLLHAYGALRQRQTAFPLIVVFALMSFRQLSGIHAVVFYTVEIFSGARSSLPHAYEAIVIGAVEVASTCAASRLVDRVGRRPLLLTSGAGTAACHAGLALYFYCLGAGMPLSQYSWLPLLLLSLFIVLHACGFGPLPWFMMAELTPSEHKNWATGVTGFLNWGSMFLVLKLFPTMTRALGDCFTFAAFAFNCAAATFFVYFLVPETKGKTLEEIQEEVGSRR